MCTNIFEYLPILSFQSLFTFTERNNHSGMFIIVHRGWLAYIYYFWESDDNTFATLPDNSGIAAELIPTCRSICSAQSLIFHFIVAMIMKEVIWKTITSTYQETAWQNMLKTFNFILNHKMEKFLMKMLAYGNLISTSNIIWPHYATAIIVHPWLMLRLHVIFQ